MIVDNVSEEDTMLNLLDLANKYSVPIKVENKVNTKASNSKPKKSDKAKKAPSVYDLHYCIELAYRL